MCLRSFLLFFKSPYTTGRLASLCLWFYLLPPVKSTSTTGGKPTVSVEVFDLPQVPARFRRPESATSHSPTAPHSHRANEPFTSAHSFSTLLSSAFSRTSKVPHCHTTWNLAGSYRVLPASATETLPWHGPPVPRICLRLGTPLLVADVRHPVCLQMGCPKPRSP